LIDDDRCDWIDSDPAKREAYDSYGHEAHQQQEQTGGGASPFGRRGSHGMHEMSPEDIFNMFFNGPGAGGFPGASAGPGFRTYRFGGRSPFQPREQQQHAREANANPFQQLLQLLPLLLLFLMSFSSFGSFGGSAPSYYLHPYGSHITKRTTSIPGISKGIPYYVDRSFQQKYVHSGNVDALRKVEKMVEVDYKEELLIKCQSEREFKRRKTYRRRKEELEEAEKIPLPSCEEYETRFGSNRSARRSASDSEFEF
jgi:DnaJ homolog subfamily B member 12